MNSDTLYLGCDCGSNDHVIAISIFNWGEDFNEDTSLHLDMQIRPHESFFRRVWVAFRYIFKKSACRYGYWTSTLISKEDAGKLKDIIEEYLDVKK